MTPDVPLLISYLYISPRYTFSIVREFRLRLTILQLIAQRANHRRVRAGALPSVERDATESKAAINAAQTELQHHKDKLEEVSAKHGRHYIIAFNTYPQWIGPLLLVFSSGLEPMVRL